LGAQLEEEEASPQRPRKQRADGLRNRQQVIEAAKHSFIDTGPLVSLETIAQRAGVGIGTVYRHFPTRAALIEAVFRRELEQLANAAAELLERLAPGEALHQWMRLYVGFIATNKVMASAASALFGISSDMYRSSVAQITDNPVLGAATDVYRSVTITIREAATLLLERAGAAGDIRTDVDPKDILRAIGGFTATYGDDVEGWEESAMRLIDILMDGLRARAPNAPQR
jgi:AcrR family transcriptional regulator